MAGARWRIYAVPVLSQFHEALLKLFSNSPTLALGLSGEPVPEFSQADIEPAEFTQVVPVEYRADLVVVLRRQGAPSLGMVVEIQLSRDERKRYVWPLYAASLRARLECPARLFVVVPDEAMARWAGRAIDLDGKNSFTPFVLGPSAVPLILDEAQARENPELAVLSVMIHGRNADVEQSVRMGTAALKAVTVLDDEHFTLYNDLVLSSLGEAARKVLQTMALAKYEYQTEFVRRYVEQGREEGRVALLTRLLTRRFGPLSDTAREQLRSASIDQLDAMGERLLTANSLSEALNG